ncbi:hypothetical protein TNCV_3861441 [Trichonephila clavipes]|nr:hypothetical protein TNCV_3861441 [Trichonephila clavipes]
MDFFWGHMKSFVYETPFPSVEDVITRISVADGKIHGILGIFQNNEDIPFLKILNRCEKPPAHALVTNNFGEFAYNGQKDYPRVFFFKIWNASL